MKMFGRASNKIEENEKVTPEDEKRQENILDLDVIKFVINEFPEIGENIKESLQNLINTLDESINIIEDKSTEVIKVNRDYKLSGKYRETSAKLYEINSNFNNYINWMMKNLKKDHQDNKEIEDVNEVNEVLNNDEEAKDLDIDGNEENILIEKLIYQDFTSYDPYKLKIEGHEEVVDGWDDMIVKTADILTKKFKCDKNLKYNNLNKDVKIVNKKSKQNDSRDIVIEMLEEHNINLNSFMVYIKK